MNGLGVPGAHHVFVQKRMRQAGESGRGGWPLRDAGSLGKSLGCSFVGLSWIPGCWWSPGERFAACSVCCCSSVGALWPAFCVGESGRDTPERFRCARSTSPGLASSYPARMCDTGRVGLLSPSPDGVGQSSSFAWRSCGARGGIRNLARQVCHVLVLRLLNVTTTVGERLRRSDFTLEASNRSAPSRGYGALPGVSDGVYGLLRLHDHGMPGVILDTGSDSVPLGGSALLCTPRDGGWRRGCRRSAPPVGCR